MNTCVMHAVNSTQKDVILRYVANVACIFMKNHNANFKVMTTLNVTLKAVD